MKKLINAADDVVGEALNGFTRTAAGVTRLSGSTTAIRTDVAQVRAAGQVAILSGGGAGHEPAHAGYVGRGLLTGAVAGEVFTSPSVDAILDAIRTVASPAGVLLIVKNYTGDRLNFGLAAELARAEGIDAVTVVVADDVAIPADSGTGRRGLAGTVLVHKIAGATAEAGRPLREVAAAAQRAADGVGTMSLALSACTVPAAGRPGFLLDDGEVEWGLGIHGEPGVERGRLGPARQVVDRLLAAVRTDRGITAGDRVAVLVNGLGATPPMELSIMAAEADRHLNEHGIEVARIWSGNFLTALDTAGCSLSLLRVDDDLLTALDAPADAPAWPATVPASTPAVQQAPPPKPPMSGTLRADDPLRQAIEAVCQTLISVRDELTELDRAVGDGDLGISLARGASALLAECPSYPGELGPAAVLRAASATVRRTVGGTSGPLYAVLLLRAAAALEQPVGPGTDTSPAAAPDAGSGPSLRAWAAALHAAVAGVQEIGGARLGDRTMVDALAPAADAFAAAVECGVDGPTAVAAAADAAGAAATGTADIRARLGRSSYLADRVLGHPDPGAQAVARWLHALVDVVPA